MIQHLWYSKRIYNQGDFWHLQRRLCCLQKAMGNASNHVEPSHCTDHVMWIEPVRCGFHCVQLKSWSIFEPDFLGFHHCSQYGSLYPLKIILFELVCIQNLLSHINVWSKICALSLHFNKHRMHIFKKCQAS